MNNTKNYDAELTKWLSTYGSVTLQRIFEHYGFVVNYAEIKTLLSDKDGIYYQFIRIPFINILNGIVINQVEGYREYIQKTLIDYLMSGAANETNGFPQGESIRESLEIERTKFTDLADQFDIEYFNHNSLISESQKELINLSRNQLHDISNVADNDKFALVALVDEFEVRGRDLNVKFREFRTLMQKMIITIQDLMKILPNYQVDEKREASIKESINFDTEIGEI